MKVVIIIPTYNERDTILALLQALQEVSRPIRNHTIALLVVDDTSPDGTADLVEEYGKSHGGIHLLRGKKEGLGRALLRGMVVATEQLHARIIGQMDADLSHDPVVLPKFLAALDSGSDFVIGSRYIPGGSIPANWGFHRKLYSVIGNAIVRFGLGFTNVHDWTGGFRVYKKEYYELAKDKVKKHGGYVFQIAFLYNAILHGAKITEVPIHFTDRRFGHSKIVPSQYVRDILVYVFVQRVKRLIYGSFGKFSVVGTIGFIINTAVLEFMVKLNFHPAVGSVVGAELAIISNFILNNAWTFGSRRARGFRAMGKFFQFNMTSVGAILIQAGTVWTGTVLFGVAYYRWFYLVGVGIGLLWNYTMYSKVIWKK